MPIGGGTFTTQNKILPGAYINFVSAGSAIQLGTRGIVALPIELNWGPENTVFSIEAADYNRIALEELGYDPTDASLLLIREALKRAQTALCYRVNGGGTKASGTIGGLSVTAKYGGTRGNDIKIAILTNVDDDESVDVVTYLGSAQMDSQTVEASGGAANLKANAFVTFGSAETLTAAVATALTGGANSTVNGESYTAALTALEVENFNSIACPSGDTSIKSLVASFVKRLRYDDGRKITGVLSGYAGDDIGLINIKNGVILADGTVVAKEKATAWVAGASAAANINESLTNTAYEDAVDVDAKYTKAQYEAAIQAGEFVFYAESGAARVLTDINSLVTFTDTVSSDWVSNRVVRVMDGWANDTARIFSRYIGETTNDDTGRTLFKADLVSLGNQYQDIGAITDFTSEDISIQEGNDRRSVTVGAALLPNDSMEKLYMTVTVN